MSITLFPRVKFNHQRRHADTPTDMLRRTLNTKSVKDTEGQPINFDEITLNGHTIHTAMVDNAVLREVPVGPIFDLFGRNNVIKANFSKAGNSYRLSVMDTSTSTHSGEGKVITYNDLKSTMDSYPGGECVDGIICASYEGEGLVFEPYVYDWKSLTTISKLMRALLVAIIFTLIVYIVRDTAFKEFVMFGLFLVKDNVFSWAQLFI